MKNSLAYRIVTSAICILATILFLFPVAIMIVRSFQVNGLNNYVRVFDKYNLLPNFRTSMIVVLGTLIIVAFVVSTAAFAFSKLEFPFKKALYYILLMGMMIPVSALIFPLFQVMRKLGLQNSPISLIFAYVTTSSCFNLMILKNYFDALPSELMQAARIDGANKWKIYRDVMLPIAKPGVSVVLIQTFLSSWNELQMARIFIANTNVQPISVIPIRFAQTISSRGFTQEVMYAALVICLLPIAIFYIFASRYLIEGLTSGAIKG